MFCPKCGTKIPDESLFCFKCGFNLSSLSLTNDTITEDITLANSELAVLDTSNIAKILDEAFALDEQGKYNEAFKLFKQIADLGNEEAILKLGMYYTQGLGCYRDVAYGVSLIKESADIGFPWACAFFYKCCKEGMAPNANISDGYEYLLTAVDHEIPTAESYLAELYFNGTIVPKDIPKAMQLYHKAAMQDELEALEQLGLIYFLGREGVDQDFNKSFMFSQKAAELGSEVGIEILGHMYYYGNLGEIDKRKAFEYYTRLENLSNWAKTNLGFMYVTGEGGITKKKLGRELVEEAANDGDSDAQYYMGCFYRDGKDGIARIPKDNEKAKFWFQQAADNGNQDAVKALEDLDSFGWGGFLGALAGVALVGVAAYSGYKHIQKKEEERQTQELIDTLVDKGPNIIAAGVNAYVGDFDAALTNVLDAAIDEDDEFTGI